MLSCGALERSNSPYIESFVESCAFKNQKEILRIWVWLGRKSWKRGWAMEKGLNGKKYSWAESGMCIYVNEREMKITV